MPFSLFKKAITQHFETMCSTGLFRVDVGDELWTTYLSSFPPGSNPLYRERTEHDCSCCRHFIRDMGGVVTTRDNNIVTLWDVDIEGPYGDVAKTMATTVRTAAHHQGIADVFFSPFRIVGTPVSRELAPSGTVKTWEHFSVTVPETYIVAKNHLATILGEKRTEHQVFLRALTELTNESLTDVLSMIEENTLYRGGEYHYTFRRFQELKHSFDGLTTAYKQSLFVWAHIATASPQIINIRNTAIGTLLVDLSEGVELNYAVQSYETKVAPQNYQRPTAVVTKRMVMQAQEEVERLGLTTALERRYATIEDITINNILWADRDAKHKMDVFESLAAQVPIKPPHIATAQDFGIEEFLVEILPNVTALEVYVGNRHAGNFVSLIAPVDAKAPHLFKWNNNFSWTYHGDVTDSIKERVKRAGGNVDADFRASLSWNNYDDLDLHLHEPGGFHIYYANGKRPYSSPHGGQLDVDMNVGGGHTRTPVENIIYPYRYLMAEGRYTLCVHQFAKRESQDIGFDAEVAFGGRLYSFSYPKPLRQHETVLIATWQYTHKEGLVILQSLPEATTSKLHWSIPTHTYRKVSVVMCSPNYWDAQATGNKHWFFMLDGCQREGGARGFFNEYLRADLHKYRKVLEMVGARMHIENSARQLSGLGFSSTLRNTLLCKVQSGSGTRLVNITF